MKRCNNIVVSEEIMLEILTKGEKIVITIDKDLLSNDDFQKFIERIKLEDIAKKSKLTKKDAFAISENIKDKWWKENKVQILK